MRNYLNNLKKNEKKGFSLVELIIVIAIMAILVGVVASQVIPYMEKSRKAKDQQQLSTICTAAVSAIAQSPEEVTGFNELLSAIDDATGKSSKGTNLGTNLKELLNASSLGDFSDATTKKFKSKAYNGGNIKVTYNSTTGVTMVYIDGKVTLNAESE